MKLQKNICPNSQKKLYNVLKYVVCLFYFCYLFRCNARLQNFLSWTIKKLGGQTTKFVAIGNPTVIYMVETPPWHVYGPIICMDSVAIMISCVRPSVYRANRGEHIIRPFSLQLVHLILRGSGWEIYRVIWISSSLLYFCTSNSSEGKRSGKYEHYYILFCI